MAMDKNSEDKALLAYFDAAKSGPATASDALMARVMQDALAVQQTAGEVVPVQNPPRGVFAGIWAAIGGWPAAAGLATATVTGVWIGASPALGVGDVMTSALGNDTAALYQIDLTSGFDFAFEEGDAG